MKGHGLDSKVWLQVWVVIVIVNVFVIVFLFVRSCLIVTLITCLKGHKSPGMLYKCQLGNEGNSAQPTSRQTVSPTIELSGDT